MIHKVYREWQTKASRELVEELSSISGDNKAIEDRFYRHLEFGTGGLRGVIGAGTNRMNIHTVALATRGVADYINATASEGSVVIAYDSRNLSVEFARTAAGVLAACNIRAYLFATLMPTPILSFAVRELDATMGIVITASHNPAKYNGYKVYGHDGGQITDKAAKDITGYIKRVKDIFDIATSPNYSVLDDTIYNKFLSVIERYSLFGECKKYAPTIVYSPLNGAGNRPVREVLARIGCNNVIVVPEQELPNGDFPTCPYPNPEQPEAMRLGIAVAQSHNAPLVLATDPDCDRVGIAVRTKKGDYKLLSGNETGILLLDYILSKKHLPPNPYIVKTIVTSDMCYPICARYGVEVREVLTGFKYIGEQITADPNGYVFGYEESYGYLVGAHARDKDAVSASMMIGEMTAYYLSQNKSLVDVLDELYAQYGYYYCTLQSIEYEGKSGIEQMNSIIASLVSSPPTRIASLPITACKDYSVGIEGLPPSNVLSYIGDNFKVLIRPSGTEPKLKIYYLVKSDTESSATKMCALLASDMKARLI